MNHNKKRGKAIACGMLISTLSTVSPIRCQTLNNFGSLAEVYTNAVGVLQSRTVDLPDSNKRELTLGSRIISIRQREFYLQSDQAKTNRILTLAGSDRKILDELNGLVGERVKVEGRLVELLKSDTHRTLYHLVVTNVTELEAKPKIAGEILSAGEAHRLVRKLTRMHCGDFVDSGRLERSAPPRLISGRWVWTCRQGSGRGDVEVQVIFAQDGSAPLVDWQFLGSEVYVPR